jgi:hypothetical protein
MTDLPPDPFDGYLVIPDELAHPMPADEQIMAKLAEHMSEPIRPPREVALPLVLTRSEYDQMMGE